MGGFYPHPQSCLLMLSIAWDRLHGKAIGLISLCRKHLEMEWFCGGWKGDSGMEKLWYGTPIYGIFKGTTHETWWFSSRCNEFLPIFSDKHHERHSNISTKKCHSFQKTPFFSPENPIFSVRFLASVLPKIAKSRKVPQSFAALTPGDGNGGNGGIFLAKLWPKKWPKDGTMNEDDTPMEWMDFSQEFPLKIRKKPWLINHQRWMFCTNSRRFWAKKWMGQICFPKNFQLPKFRT